MQKVLHCIDSSPSPEKYFWYQTAIFLSDVGVELRCKPKNRDAIQNCQIIYPPTCFFPSLIMLNKFVIGTLLLSLLVLAMLRRSGGGGGSFLHHGLCLCLVPPRCRARRHFFLLQLSIYEKDYGTATHVCRIGGADLRLSLLLFLPLLLVLPAVALPRRLRTFKKLQLLLRDPINLLHCRDRGVEGVWEVPLIMFFPCQSTLHFER